VLPGSGQAAAVTEGSAYDVAARLSGLEDRLESENRWVVR
jgi:hypothetical protein